VRFGIALQSFSYSGISAKLALSRSALRSRCGNRQGNPTNYRAEYRAHLLNRSFAPVLSIAFRRSKSASDRSAIRPPARRRAPWVPERDPRRQSYRRGEVAPDLIALERSEIALDVFAKEVFGEGHRAGIPY